MRTSLRISTTPQRQSKLASHKRRQPIRPVADQYPRRRFLHLAAGAAALPAASRIASAQAYPSRPITIVVPFAAGGSLDVVARILAQRMRLSLRQPVIIENVAGASGTIAVGRVARAAPGGYTISIGNLGTHVLNGATYALPYDLLTDFDPVSPIASYLASAPEIPTVDEAGLPGFHLSSWDGLWVRRGTAKDAVGKLNAAVVEALADPSVRARIAENGREIFPRDQQTPEALGALQKAEIEKWWPFLSFL
jgi:tripartite-type tricarboxylate transporter receptor subunit TctC